MRRAEKSKTFEIRDGRRREPFLRNSLVSSLDFSKVDQRGHVVTLATTPAPLSASDHRACKWHAVRRLA